MIENNVDDCVIVSYSYCVVNTRGSLVVYIAINVFSCER